MCVCVCVVSNRGVEMGIHCTEVKPVVYRFFVQCSKTDYLDSDCNGLSLLFHLENISELEVNYFFQVRLFFAVFI